MELIADGLEVTERWAKVLATTIQSRLDKGQPSLTIGFQGALGAGKTTLISSFCSALGVADDQVSSPTFALQNVYQGVVTVDHFDFYRIQTDEELFELGFEEMLDQPGIHLIEWADKFIDCLPECYLNIEIVTLADRRRRITFAEIGAQTGLPEEVGRIWQKSQKTVS
jgi:tRNA threonylcarbamoyladenosine biosynthesis protein TsaE